MAVTGKTIRNLLFIVVLVLSAGVARGQDPIIVKDNVKDDFPTFVGKYTSDCEVRLSRTLSPLVLTVHNYEDTSTVTVIDKSDGTDRWHTFVCSDLREFFPKYIVSITSCIEDERADERCLSATVEDTGILIEFRFGLVDNKWVLKRIDDYSM